MAPMPKSFSEDGAVGAGGTSPGDQVGGILMNDPGPAPAPDPSVAFDKGIGAATSNRLAGLGSLPGAPGASGIPGTGADPTSGGFGGGGLASPGTSPAAGPAPLTGSGGFGGGGLSGGGAPSSGATSLASPVGLAFAGGGAIEDTNGSPEQDAVSKALDSVDAVLAYGRKLHGLGGGNQEAGGIQTADVDNSLNSRRWQNAPPMSNTIGQPIRQPAPTKTAANMPAQPPSQSESGVKPIQPMPGPLPPTSNPFGKRADAGDDGDQDNQQPGAINTDEETA